MASALPGCSGFRRPPSTTSGVSDIALFARRRTVRSALTALLPPPPTDLQDEGATFDSGSGTHHLTLYRHASGALVFGGGTCQWSWGLDEHHDSPIGVPAERASPNSIRVVRHRNSVPMLIADAAKPCVVDRALIRAAPIPRSSRPP